MQVDGIYKVVALGTFVLQLREVTARAEQHGLKEEFLKDVREVMRQLATSPASRGDPVWSYTSAGLEEYHWLVQMLSVRYGVDPENHVVYLKGCKPVLNHPLAEP